MRDQPWHVHVALGAQFLPSYDEGENSGFDEQRFFGNLTADGAWQYKDTKHLFHWGVSLDLLGEPVRREDTNGNLPADFNDVADTVQFSTYVQWQRWSWDRVDVKPVVSLSGDQKPRERIAQSYLGPVVRVGIKSRENLTDTDDSVNLYGTLGLRYTFEDYRRRGYRNGLARGFAEVAWGMFEDYAGVSNDDRVVITTAYRLFEDQPAYIGFQGNVGEGPDELAIFVAFAFEAEQILVLF